MHAHCGTHQAFQVTTSNNNREAINEERKDHHQNADR